MKLSSFSTAVSLDKLFLWCMTSAAVAFPLSHRLYFISLLLAGILWVLWFSSNKERLQVFKNTKINDHFKIIALLYFFLGLTMLYTENVRQGWRELETMSSFFVVPFLVFYGPIDKKGLKLIIRFFCLSVSLIGFTCLIFVILKAIANDQPVHFVFTNYWYQTTYFTELFEIHPTYLSIFVSFATIYHLNDFLHERKLRRRIVDIVCLLILSIANLLLISRGGLIALAICLFFFLVTQIKTRKKYYVLALLIVASYFPFSYVHGFKRFVEPFLYLANPAMHLDGIGTSTNLHLRSWRCALEKIASQYVIFGYGAGDEVDELTACYSDHGFNEMLALRLNAHNQYLSTMMQGGVLALLLLLITYHHSFKRAIETSDILFASFLLLIITTSLFESILNVYRGVAFFSLFNAVLVKKAIVSKG